MFWICPRSASRLSVRFWLRATTLTMHVAISAKCSVERVSAKSSALAEQLATRCVLELPPKACLSTLVSSDCRKMPGCRATACGPLLACRTKGQGQGQPTHSLGCGQLSVGGKVANRVTINEP
jgi:hypothetical protein